MGATASFREGTVRLAGSGKEAAKRRNSRYDPANRRDFRRNDDHLYLPLCGEVGKPKASRVGGDAWSKRGPPPDPSSRLSPL